MYVRPTCALFAHLHSNNSTTFNKHKSLASKAQLSKQMFFEGVPISINVHCAQKGNKINMCNKRFYPMQLEFHLYVMFKRFAVLPLFLCLHVRKFNSFTLIMLTTIYLDNYLLNTLPLNTITKVRILQYQYSFPVMFAFITIYHNMITLSTFKRRTNPWWIC